jgi:hypothetical protein
MQQEGVVKVSSPGGITQKAGIKEKGLHPFTTPSVGRRNPYMKVAAMIDQRREFTHPL